jgi:predicted nuclease of predicted toxin-antitoxin system
MRVLCDVHIPYRLVSQLRELGIDATHVNRVLEGSRTKDSAIAAFADANKMLLITKDGDFRDSHFLNGSPARVVRLTLGNLSNTDLVALVLQHWSAIRDISAREDCYIELSLKGVIRLPPAGSAS